MKHARSGKWSIFAETFDYGNELRLWMLRDVGEDRRARVLPVVFQEIDESHSSETDPPALTFRQRSWDGPDQEGFLQAMMDMAWQLGLRPSDMREAASETVALKDHVADLKEITRLALQKVARGDRA